MFKAKQSGLTLVELLVSVIILGVLMVIIGPLFSNALTFMDAAKRSEVQLNNQKLASGMLSYARNKDGKLPPQRSDFSLYDEEATAGSGYDLFLELSGAGVAPNQINTTGFGVNAKKMYQLAGPIPFKQPVYFSSGDLVTLYYEVGVIYQTNCPAKEACANSTAPWSNGGADKLVVNNIVGWKVNGGDYAPVMFNTLAEQKSMLRTTIGRINRLSDRISSSYYAKARATEQSGVNHFAGSNGSADPASGCWSGWDRLISSSTLATIGLNREEYGKTAWGGRVEYCRDYKPGGLAGQPPFYAALRINKDLKVGSHPSTTNSNNVIFTF